MINGSLTIIVFHFVSIIIAALEYKLLGQYFVLNSSNYRKQLMIPLFF